tara:strand:+ start:455 stop:646 length:192 start_codon:yes stop_codon:yes gene_type:complete
MIINKFKILHIFVLFRYLEKYFDKYPIIKKKINELREAPIPKLNFCEIRKFFDIFPKTNTVSE